jgi:hypothetical protein
MAKPPDDSLGREFENEPADELGKAFAAEPPHPVLRYKGVPHAAQGESNTPDWSHTEEVQPGDRVDASKIDVWDSALRAAPQGLSAGFDDEAAGAMGAVLSRGIPGEERSFLEAYRDERDEHRRYNDIYEQAHPYVTTGTRMAGDMTVQTLAALATGGASLTPTAQAKWGALNALGASRDELTTGDPLEYEDAGLKMAAGAGASYLLSRGGRALADKLINTAGRRAAAEKGIKEAEERAAAIAAEKAREETQRAVSSAGGQSVHLMNIAKSAAIMDDLPPMPAETAQGYAARLNAGARAALKKIGELEDALGASGREETSGGPLATELASKAKAFEKAQRAAEEVAHWREVAERLRQRAAEVLKTGAIPDAARASGQDLLKTAGMREAISNAMENMAEDVPGEAARVLAAREMAKTVAEGEKARAAEYLKQQLDPSEWMKRQVNPRIARYGPVFAGNLAGGAAGVVLGSGFDGSVAKVATVLAAQSAGTLAGAGIRPALQSLKRLAKTPLAEVMWNKALLGTLQASPALLGAFGPMLVREYQRNGEEGVIAMDYALRDNPDWEDVRSQVMGGAAPYEVKKTRYTP